MDDHIDHAMIQQIFSPLEALGKLFPNGIFDDSLAGKADQCAGLRDMDVAEHGIAGRHAASRGSVSTTM